MVIILLEKTRKISKFIQATDSISFQKITEVLHEILEANVSIFDANGQLLGFSLKKEERCEVSEHMISEKESLPQGLLKRFNRNAETLANVHLKNQICMMRANQKCPYPEKCYTAIPIMGNAVCLGSLMLTRINREFDEGDLLLGEYAATCIGVQMLHNKTIEVEEAAQKKAMVQIAYSNLSYSETEAITAILKELPGNEGLLVASKIADKAGITRSVIVNALRKFESAGVIRTQSLGMKGTHVKILNDFVKNVQPEL